MDRHRYHINIPALVDTYTVHPGAASRRLAKSGATGTLSPAMTLTTSPLTCILPGVRACLVLVIACLGLLVSPAVVAQQHRATRLGDPAHRFAPPLRQPEDLRRLFADPALRNDFGAILRQAKWSGNLGDLLQAARTEPISDIRLPKGTRMPFMSSRTQGKPVALIDVLWAGKDPVEAFAFKFTSKGRLYHCITPKPCSNFYVVDLGPAPAPSLRLEKLAPATVSICAPIEFRYVVRNVGNAPATGVRVSESLPDGLVAPDQQRALGCDLGDLAPGESRDCARIVAATGPGTFATRAFAQDSQGRSVETSKSLVAQAPVLALDCQAPADLPVGRPFTVCLSLRNTGSVPEPRATLALAVPRDVTLASATENATTVNDQIVWELGELAPKAERKFCITLIRREPGQLDFTAIARGTCAQPVQSACASRVSGVPAILLEVVDLADPIEVGNPVEYEVRVTNQGSSALTNVRLACLLPELQEYASGGGATPIRGEARQALSEPLPTLAPKAEAVWRLSVKALAQGDARFRVDLTADQFQRPVEEWEATSQY